MTLQPKTVLAPLIYYDLLERPLTAIEIFKYLRADALEISFFNAWQTLKKSVGSKNLIREKNGLYFLAGRHEIMTTRSQRLKFSQLKWKKLKKIGRYLAVAPWLRLVAVTGSLTSYNAKQRSDFDLLVIIKKNRLWLGRLLLTGLVGALGKRRHGQLTKDRICLNCYLTETNLEITRQAKPRDFHSAQEYGRLTPILEIQKGLYEKFTRANQWLADFLKNYPWLDSQGAKKIKSPTFLNWARKCFELVFSGQTGDWLEKIAGQCQIKRINKKRQNEQPGPDQVFVSDNCLMFHPQSKSDKLMKEFNFKMEQFN